MAVDIGGEAINRAYYDVVTNTIINKTNPATTAGQITSVELWAYAAIEDLKIGTFYLTNGNTLKCRAVAVIGDVASGSKITKSGLTLQVEIGDFLGCCGTVGSLDRVKVGYDGMWYTGIDCLFVDNETTYLLAAGDLFSLGGYISAAAAGRSFGFIIG